MKEIAGWDFWGAQELMSFLRDVFWPWLSGTSPLRELVKLLRWLWRAETRTPAGRVCICGFVLVLMGLAVLSVPALAFLTYCAATGQSAQFSSATGQVFSFFRWSLLYFAGNTLLVAVGEIVGGRPGAL